MRIDLKIVVALSFATLTSACGNFNLNKSLTSKSQQNSIDSLMEEAQYEYDKGRYDSALSLTDKALHINPNSESPAILKSYVYLSKAGLDGINISKKLIDAKGTTATTTPTTTAATTTTVAKTGDTTTDNFNVFKSVLHLGPTDFEAMGTPHTIGAAALTIYLPKSATAARAGNSNTLSYLNQAIATLCPLIPSSANPANDTDARHACTKNFNSSGSTGRGNFAWALAHLGEAISFYSVVLYDSNGDGIPNIQAAIPTETLTQANASTFIATINTLNNAINAIFPTDPVAAADSMLNGLFKDLETASTALAAIPGIPPEVSASVQKSITDLNTKINAINTTANSQTAQNEALKNSLTTGVSKTLASKIESNDFKTLNTTQQKQACCVYRNMNATATMPTTCSAVDYTTAACAAILPQ
ncbi:MAG: hypothetical protein H7249_02850 [Chitinophagaceae bacterium]|nr:hypothetical protein [Oligoflexus sp.]